MRVARYLAPTTPPAFVTGGRALPVDRMCLCTVAFLLTMSYVRVECTSRYYAIVLIDCRHLFSCTSEYFM